MILEGGARPLGPGLAGIPTESCGPSTHVMKRLESRTPRDHQPCSIAHGNSKPDRT